MRRKKLTEKEKKELKKILRKFKKDPQTFINTIIAGTIAVIVSSVIMEALNKSKSKEVK